MLSKQDIIWRWIDKQLKDIIIDEIITFSITFILKFDKNDKAIVISRRILIIKEGIVFKEKIWEIRVVIIKNIVTVPAIDRRVLMLLKIAFDNTSPKFWLLIVTVI